MAYLVLDKAFIKQHNEGYKLNNSIEDYPDGIIIPINKPYRWTSSDVVRKIKFAACKHFSKKKLKVGHAGTLDPLATGVLLICIDKATKEAEILQKHDKEYIAGICFGATTPSYDLEKDIDKHYPYKHICKDDTIKELKNFIGEQQQIAPLFSAKSIDGVRAYELARKEYQNSLNNKSEFNHNYTNLLKTQNINIYEVELLDFIKNGIVNNSTDNSHYKINIADISNLILPHATIRISCSKGTYIRAFARDLGERLNSGGFLDGLCRTRSGNFQLSQCLSVDEALNLL